MSRVEGYYYHCPKCKSWVPATERRCSCGQFLDHLTPVLRPTQEWPEREGAKRAGSGKVQLSESKREESAQNYPLMRCSRCGITLKTDARSCPECGGFLLIEREEWSGESSGFWEETAEEDYREAETELAVGEDCEEENTEDTQKPLFYFNARRYDNGAAIAANTGYIPVCTEGRQKMLIGRNLFVRDPRLFFSAGNREIDSRYRTISRNNALLGVEDGRLYIELYREDGAGKSAVYVNEERLGSEEVRELHHGDRIRLGGKKTVHDGTIDMEIISADEKERYDRNREREESGSLAEMKGMVVKLCDNMMQMQGDIRSIRQMVAQINPEDLAVRRGEDAEAYENRLAASVPEAAYPTREECVAGFLEAVLPKDSQQYREKMAFFRENDRRFHLLYQAAFFENACAANGLEDYAGPMSFLGKAMEGFVMGEIADVVKTFNGKDYQTLVAQKGNRINQSDILNLCRQNGAINRILLAAGYTVKEKQRMWGRVNGALNVLHSVRIARNAASHCDPDTEMPADRRVDAITRKKYGEIKESLLTSDAIEVMHNLYLRSERGKSQT